MKDCRDCKSYKGCIGKEFYTYADIRWCPYQVIWIIENSFIPRNGRWPPDPAGSSYVDPNIKTSVSGEAYFAKWCEVLAEVENRIKRAGIYGKLLVAEIRASEVELSPESKLALMYVKGRRRKRMSFLAWNRKRRYEHKVTKM